MAFTRLNSLPFSLLILFSLLAIAFAADYGTNYIPADSSQAKPNYAEKPSTYDNKPESEKKQNYGSKPEIYKPKTEEIEKPEYEKKPYVVESKPEAEEKPEFVEKPDYETKQYTYTPKTEEKQKPEYEKKPYVVESKPEAEEKPEFVEKPDYETKQYPYTPKTEEKQKPEYEKKPYSIAVEGFVYCKTGPSHYPIPGALAKVICQAIDEINGVEKTVLCSAATDAKGYFYATLSSVNESNLKLKDCKAFLETSPEKACNVPTDVNKGITGFPLSGDYKVLNEKHTNLYFARPFFFTSESDEPKPATPNGY